MKPIRCGNKLNGTLNPSDGGLEAQESPPARNSRPKRSRRTTTIEGVRLEVIDSRSLGIVGLFHLFRELITYLYRVYNPFTTMDIPVTTDNWVGWTKICCWNIALDFIAEISGCPKTNSQSAMAAMGFHHRPVTFMFGTRGRVSLPDICDNWEVPNI